MNISFLNSNQKSYIEDILERYENNLNFQDINSSSFNSVHTKHIELIFGQEEFISLSLLIKKEDLKEFNIISIYEPGETILPPELYENFYSHLILEFSDIRRDFRDMFEKNKINKETYDLLERDEIKNSQFDILKTFILNNKHKKFIINCHAGISRSAAIGYILEDILNKDEQTKKLEQDKILSHWRYSPNKIIIEKFKGSEFFNQHDYNLDLDNIF